MRSDLKLNLFVLWSACLMLVGCFDSSNDNEPCDPALDAGCAQGGAESPAEGGCDPEEAGCCNPRFEDGCECFREADGVEVFDCVDEVTFDGEGCFCMEEAENESPEETDPLVPDPFLFVMVEDLTPNPSGEAPGADIDAIGLIKSGGEEHFAAVVDSSEVDCDNNTACDDHALLGKPDVVNDGVCFGGGAPDVTRFTSLGGARVVVSFEGGAEVENGDSIHVYEIGATECGRFDDDPFSVSVGVSHHLDGVFILVGKGGDGNNIIPVMGL